MTSLPLPSAEDVIESFGTEPWERPDLKKPSRAARLTKGSVRRKARRLERQQASRNKQRQDYGRREGEVSWPVFKERIKSRDGRRCVMPRCETPTLGITVHHVSRTVGAGGRNTEDNAATLCAWCHDKAHNGHLSRRQIQAVLSDRHGFTYRDQEDDAA